jgi:hypothetical protein
MAKAPVSNNETSDMTTETEEQNRSGTSSGAEENESGKADQETQALKDSDKKEALNPLQVVSSVFAAGLGVQSSKNRERDFKQGRAGTFIIAGLLFTALFIGTVYTIVSLVLSSR